MSCVETNAQGFDGREGAGGEDRSQGCLGSGFCAEIRILGYSHPASDPGNAGTDPGFCLIATTRWGGNQSDGRDVSGDCL